MECEEIRVDMRIPDMEGMKESRRVLELQMKLNQTMPFCYKV